MWRSGLGVVGVASVRRRAGGVDVLDDEDCAPVERLGVAWRLRAEGRLWRPRRVDGRRGDGVAAVRRVAGGGSGWRGAPRTHRGGGARSARARAADTRPQQPLCCAARRLAAARLANGGVSGDAWRQGKRGRAGGPGWARGEAKGGCTATGGTRRRRSARCSTVVTSGHHCAEHARSGQRPISRSSLLQIECGFDLCVPNAKCGNFAD